MSIESIIIGLLVGLAVLALLYEQYDTYRNRSKIARRTRRYTRSR